MEAELSLLEEVHMALARADTSGEAGDIYQGLAQAVGGLTSWLRATAQGPRMHAQGRERHEGVWTGEQARCPLPLLAPLLFPCPGGCARADGLVGLNAGAGGA